MEDYHNNTEKDIYYIINKYTYGVISPGSKFSTKLEYTLFINKDEYDKNLLEIINDFDKIKYEERVDELISMRYNNSQEKSILRQRDTKNEEFKEYYDFCEECKKIAYNEQIKTEI